MMDEKPHKAIKQINKQRQREYLPPVEPDRSYKRQFTKTKMSWPMYLLLKKQYAVLLVVIAAIAALFVAVIWVVWNFVIPGFAKLMEVLF